MRLTGEDLYPGAWWGNDYDPNSELYEFDSSLFSTFEFTSLLNPSLAFTSSLNLDFEFTSGLDLIGEQE